MHAHFCDCDGCLNQGGGVLLSELAPHISRYGYPSQRFRRQAVPKERKRAQNARAYQRRKLREAGA